MDDRANRVDEQARRDLDATLADTDQTASDTDQTIAESEQSLSDEDRALAEADQRASNRDQLAAERDRAMSGPAQPGDIAAGRDARRRSTLERESTALARIALATTRLELARQRDERSLRRDELARLRDEAAAAADDAAVAAERVRGTTVTAASARADAARARARAAADRRRAASDRAQSAREREQAEKDRLAISDALATAHTDDLTGTWRRAMGTLMLEHEIERAHRGDSRLMLAFVDVDGLKAVNSRSGHAAGDALLRRVVAVIRSHLRAYDPVVRMGGDEFLCAAGQTDPDEFRHRFDGITRELGQPPESCSISVGFATLRVGDTAASLVARADADLLASG